MDYRTNGPRLRYVSVRNTGSKSAVEQQADKAISRALPISEGEVLRPRCQYWFVLTEEATIALSTTKIEVKHHFSKVANGCYYYLYQVQVNQIQGSICFRFSDGSVESVHFSSSKDNKKYKKTDATSKEIATTMPMTNWPDSPHTAMTSTNYQISAHYTNANNAENDPMMIFFNALDQMQMTEDSQRRSGRFVNVLILIPNEEEWLRAAEETLNNLRFRKIQSTETKRHLYGNYKHDEHKSLHVLIFPYEHNDEKEEDFKAYLSVTSEIVLFYENDDEQRDNVMAARTSNVPIIWQSQYNDVTVDIDFTKLSKKFKFMSQCPESTNIFSVKKNSSLDMHILTTIFINSFTTNNQLPEERFLCFQFQNDNNQTLEDYARATDEAYRLIIDPSLTNDAVAVHGTMYQHSAAMNMDGVHVYLQCPIFTPWYILQSKEYFLELVNDGLIEICDASLSDVDSSMQRSDNQAKMLDLMHLQEQIMYQWVDMLPGLGSFRLSFKEERRKMLNFVEVPREGDGKTHANKSRIRYVRLKDVGTKLPAIKDRNKRIVEIAEHLPEGNRLGSRAIYWFVTTEEAEILFKDKRLFIITEQNRIVDENGTLHYLTCIDFKRNKRGIIEFKFMNGDIEPIYCESTTTRKSDQSNFNTFSEDNKNNESAEKSNVNNGPKRTVPTNEPLIVSILLLVPDDTYFIDSVDLVLCDIGFTKEVSSSNQLRLYSQTNLINTIRNVLLFPYGKDHRFFAVSDVLPAISEVILLIENTIKEQQDALMSISKITNFDNTNERQLALKEASFKSTEISANSVNPSVQILLLIEELKQAVLGGIICKKNNEFAESFKKYFLQWTLGRVEKRVVQNIYLSFRFEPRPVHAFSDDSAASLAALNIDFIRKDSDESVATRKNPPTIDALFPAQRTILEYKCAEMKKFDHKWTKTLEDCYNNDRLHRQLFTFQTDKNVKIAVRVFISSASAGMATNVAKLMRQFNGKSIVDGVHSGLQIANTIVEWNQSGLVHIGELKHTSATAVLFDMQESVRFDFNDEIANKIINFIQQWNVEHHYSSTEYNSHRFVRDFLQETLNVSLVERFKGPLGAYMDYVMKTGDSTPRLISKSHGTMVFKTHAELEEADQSIRNELSIDEIKLLKIFHRGFQLQEAAHGKDVSSCCYGLPTNGLEILNDSGNSYGVQKGSSKIR